MENVYLPIDDLSSNRCYTFINSNTIRVYKDPFVLGNNNYTDYFIKSHYLEQSGVQEFTSTSEYPTCIDTSSFTNKIEYRFDFPIILFTAFLLFVITFIFPYLVFRRLFGRWLKV